MKVALLHWYQANESGITFIVGEEPRVICFDGSSVWVACKDRVARLRANDGEDLGGFDTRENSDIKGICFDGANIWATDFANDQVAKRPLVGSFLPGSDPSINIPRPWGICFDGTYLWVTSEEDNEVYRIRPGDSTVIGDPIAVGNEPRDICFDGAYIWVTSRGDNSITKIRASDGEVLNTFPGLIEPRGICFGGSYIWVAISGYDSTIWPWPAELEQTPAVIALNRISAAPMYFKSESGNPSDICFDGESIWVTNHDLDTVTKIAVGGGFIGTFAVGDEPMGLCFDGVNVWVTNNNGYSVTKL